MTINLTLFDVVAGVLCFVMEATCSALMTIAESHGGSYVEPAYTIFSIIVCFICFVGNVFIISVVREALT